ncbi:MAG: tRNA pseudouridine(38-40) synthase TruA [Candidatus Promineifilaceae bacterium]
MEKQRFRALIEYDGTQYFGFQRQRADQVTIQGALETALRTVTGEPAAILAAGRTDSGVHASGQVVCFDLTWRHGVDALQRALNVNLPADIVVKRLEVTHAAFHPRFDARRRSYRYQIYNEPVRSPAHRLYSWHVSQPLDMAQMNEAAAHLIGVHDFATFGQPPQGTNTVREVFQAEWRREADLLTFTIEANAFLYQMVRSLVGSLKLVGEGKWTVATFVTALHGCDRKYITTVAPPHGLFLVSVTY